eukprot:353631-Chlamydomonas_euryale.AAC.9
MCVQNSPTGAGGASPRARRLRRLGAEVARGIGAPRGQGRVGEALGWPGCKWIGHSQRALGEYG